MLDFLASLTLLLAAQDDWPTLHRDLQRSGHTSETLSGPFERKWFRDFHDEMIASRVEAIIADDKCYVGPFSGNLYALNVADGTTAWTFKTGGPIGHSAAYSEGRVYVGADDAKLYCLDAGTGKPLWTYPAAGGGWGAPTAPAGPAP